MLVGRLLGVSVCLGAALLVSARPSQPPICTLEKDSTTSLDMLQYTLCVLKELTYISEQMSILHEDTSASSQVSEEASERSALETSVLSLKDRYPDIDDVIHTFRYCQGLTSHQCSLLVQLLEDLQHHSADDQLAPSSDDKSRGTYADESDEDDDAEDPQKKISDGQQQSASRVKRSPISYDLLKTLQAMTKRDPKAQKIVDLYMQWREKNGYGKSASRWGRSVQSGKEDETKPNTAKAHQHDPLGGRSTSETPMEHQKRSHAVSDDVPPETSENDAVKSHPEVDGAADRDILSSSKGVRAVLLADNGGSESQSRSSRRRVRRALSINLSRMRLTPEVLAILAKYQQWKTRKGYGSQVSRWG